MNPSYPTSNNKSRLNFRTAATLGSGLRGSFATRTHMHSGHPTRGVRAKPAQPARASPPSGLDGGSLGSVPHPPPPQPVCTGFGAGARPLHPPSPTLPCPVGPPSLSPGIRREAEPPGVPRPRGRKGWASVTRGQGWDLLSVLLEEVGGGDIRGGPGAPGTPILDYKLSTWDGQGAEAAIITHTHSPISDRSSALGQPPSATRALRTGGFRSARDQG